MRYPKNRLNGRLAALAAAVLVVVAGAGWAYADRQDLRDGYQRWLQGPLPPPLTAAEVKERGSAPPAPDDGPLPAAADDPVEGDPPPTAPPGTADATAPVLSGTGSLPDALREPAQPPAAPEEPTVPPPLPKEINLKVPMVYQAPLSNWDALHEDTCEEASLLMVKAFLGGENELAREEMEKRLLALVEREKEGLGFFESTDVEQTVLVASSMLGLAGLKILPVGSIDDVKRQLAAGRPVLLPASGKELGNPNFRNGGPLYHMLVAKGYTAGRIITNDPGTRKGADYLYDPDVLFEAIHDWNGGDVVSGSKVMIVPE